MSSDPTDSLLDTFAAEGDPDLRVRALTDLMTMKALPKRADDTRFGAGARR